MKRILYTLLITALVWLIFSIPAWAGVASPGFSSLNGDVNPAVQGLMESPFQLGYGSGSTIYSANGTDTKTSLTRLSAILRYDSFFASHAKDSSTTGGNKTTITENALGWRWPTVAASLFQTTAASGTTSEKVTSAGISWQISPKFYAGLTSEEKNASGSNNNYAGVAFVLPGTLRIEYAAFNGRGSAGELLRSDLGEAELKFGQVLIGMAIENTAVNGLYSASNRTYIGYEPDGSGLCLLLETFDNDDAAFVSGSRMSVGYNF